MRLYIPMFRAHLQRSSKVRIARPSMHITCGAERNNSERSRFCSSLRVKHEAGNEERCWSKQLNEGELGQAVGALELIVQHGSCPPGSLFVEALKLCIAKKDLVLGRGIHAFAVKCGYESNRFMANHIIRMYASQGKLQEAYQVFGNLVAPNAHSWSSIISGYAEHGQPAQAIQFYWRMRQSTVMPDNHVFAAVLKACANTADLRSGRKIHADVLRCAEEPIEFVGSCLVDMYAKCGSLDDARAVFNSLTSRDVVTWNAMLTGYVQQGLSLEALSLYTSMQKEVTAPADQVTFVCLLKACGISATLVQGKRLHSQIQERGLENDVVIGSCLVDMYAKCGCLDEARSVFDKLLFRDVVTWTAMIAGYAQRGLGQEALALFARMQLEGVFPADYVAFVCLLRACSSIGALDQGRHLHFQILEQGMQGDVAVGSCLVDMYSKCGKLDTARSVFDNLVKKNVVTWNAMLAGYAQHGLGLEALNLYATMLKENITTADHVTFVCLLKACASIAAIHQGKQLHLQIQERGLESDLVIGNCLVDMYVKCGCLVDARRVFNIMSTRDVVTWNAMLAGYAHHGLGQEALALHESMQHEGITPAGEITFACLLRACASIGALDQGKQLHAQVQDECLECDSVVASCLVDMYARCGSLDDARKVFDNLAKKDLVTWNSMLAGYALHGLGHDALALYTDMEHEGVIAADHATFVCLLKACASISALPQGIQIHAQIQERGLESHMVVGSCLVYMYAKCGSLEAAQRVFDNLTIKDIVTWNAMLSGYAQHGFTLKALECYEKMLLSNINPNGVTFLSLISACSHAGEVDKGLEYFRSMSAVHSMTPDIEHHVSMLDLFGRAGRFVLLEDWLSKMPMEPDLATWLCVLGACRKHGNITLGQQAFSRAIQLQPKHPAAYVLMSHIYADAGLPDSAKRVENLRKRERAWKEPGRSWIQHEQEAHSFLVGDRSHPQNEQLYDLLEKVSSQLKIAGHI